MEYRCVVCGHGIKRLYVQYSPGNIRLMKCENCKAVADEFIECEIMIILIDLILHKPKAYRHILYNVLDPHAGLIKGLTWKSCVGYLLLDAYTSLFIDKTKEEWGSSTGFSSIIWGFEKILVDVFLGNFIYLCIILLSTQVFLRVSAESLRYKDLLLAILISSYFKMFLFAMMVWEFPSSVIFIIDLFVLSSNAVALQVITESAMSRCVGTCIGAYLIKIFITHVFE